MTENNKNQPRAWIYARVPDNLPETQASFNACCQQAARDGCCIAGGGMDLTCTHTIRCGYRDMLQQIKAGNVDRVYICRISAARFASQSILDILRLTVLAMQGRSYGQQSLAELNRQNRQLASVDVNDRTLRLVKRQLNQYSVDFSVTKDKDSGRMYLWFKGQDVDRIQTALENCIAERGQERPTLQELSARLAARAREAGQTRTPPVPEHGERL